MAKTSSSSSTPKDAYAVLHSLCSAYAATPTNLKIIDLYVMFALFTSLIQLQKDILFTIIVIVVVIIKSFVPVNRRWQQNPLNPITFFAKSSLLVNLFNWLSSSSTRPFLSISVVVVLSFILVSTAKLPKHYEQYCFDIQFKVVYMTIVGSFPFNSFLSGVLSCIGTAVLAVCFRIQINKENKDFKDLSQERAFADFALCNFVLHLVIMNFLG